MADATTVLLACLGAAERAQEDLVAWVDEQGRLGRVVTVGGLDAANPESWPLAVMRPVRPVPEKSSVCLCFAPLPVMLRADRPPLEPRHA